MARLRRVRIRSLVGTGSPATNRCPFRRARNGTVARIPRDPLAQGQCSVDVTVHSRAINSVLQF